MESTAGSPIKKSSRVVLTVAAAMSMVARGQQPRDPCESASFNTKACKIAVQRKGYCDGSAWVPATYQESYPYYYDSYQAYLATGGVVTAAEAGNCRRPHYGLFGGRGLSRGGFGSTGAGHHGGG
ncbi:MAG: hypothetical protein JWO19_2532 [Bryobacterales bacterium]|jgi:hypothetical protein|nr:hypothetical protein [Bryobacterales bacterium]